MIFNRFSLLVVLALFGASFSLFADDSQVERQLEGVLGELQKIRILLERSQLSRDIGPPPSSTVALDLKGVPHLGATDAPLTIVEFTDFECPYCRQFFNRTFTDVKRNLIDSHKVRYYSMDMPSPNHRNALLAAQAGRCAGEQGKYWTMHDLLQSSTVELSKEGIMSFARESNVDSDLLRQCIEAGRHKDAILNDMKSARAKGIQGTPSFVIGKSTIAGVEGEVVVGAVPYGIIEKKLKQFGHQ